MGYDVYMAMARIPHLVQRRGGGVHLMFLRLKAGRAITLLA